jgi:hypothetical protein
MGARVQLGHFSKLWHASVPASTGEQTYRLIQSRSCVAVQLSVERACIYNTSGAYDIHVVQIDWP